MMKKRERMMKDLEKTSANISRQRRRTTSRAACSPEEAHYAAIRKFGNVMRVEEDTRDVWSFIWLEQFWQDIRYAFRMLRKSRGFTAVAVLTLAFWPLANHRNFQRGIRVLLQPLPYTDRTRIMSVFEGQLEWHMVSGCGSKLRRLSRSEPQLPVDRKVSCRHRAVSGASEPTRTTVAAVSPVFLKVLGVQPILGRDFGAGDAKKGAGPTVLVSYGYWRQYLGSSRDLRSRT